ncbi:MAG: iron uptake porin [Spirulina sp.]
MSEILKKTLLAAPATLGALLFASGEAMANPVGNSASTSEILQQIETYRVEGRSRSQFTGASKFSDVSPGDWAFQALDDLVRRYDCLKGYPNGTYRGNRALSRYEFAAGLNACLQQIERLIAETTADFVTRDELETVRRLMEEFEAELATLGTRVDNLEGRVAFLEDNQFSTTTKLVGEVIFNLDIATGNRAKIYGLDGADYNDLSVLNGFAFDPDLSESSAVDTVAQAASFAQIIDRNRMLGLFDAFGVVDSVTMGEAFVGNFARNLAFNNNFLDFDGDGSSAGDGEEIDTIITNFISDLNTINSDGNTRADDFNRSRNSAVALGYRARLNFDTSFTGRDRLRTRIQARNLRNLTQFGTGTPQVEPNKYGFTANNDVRLSKLWYRFPIGEDIMFHIAAAGISIDDILDSETTSPYAVDGLPLGLAYNNLFYEMPNDEGAVGANIRVADWLTIDVGYFMGAPADANDGVFAGGLTIPIQFNFDVAEEFKFAVGYGYAWQPGGRRTAGNVTVAGATSVLGASPFIWVGGNGDDVGRILESATASNHFNLSASWDAAEWMNVSAFVGYANAVATSGLRKGDDADYWTWGINFGFPDLFKEDDVIVAGFGMLPYLGGVNNGPSDRSPAYMANLEYRFPLTDNIEVAPGMYAVFNPNGNPNNDTIWVGMVRTIFSF